MNEKLVCEIYKLITASGLPLVLNAVITTFFNFIWLCFEELPVALKFYYEKNSLVETT